MKGFEHLIPSIDLPAPDDRHVAAAIHGRASLIVTFNLKNFPADTLTRSHAITCSHSIQTTAAFSTRE
ncbi:hypothetical protein [Paraburkholderia tropica]|uniref:hypothetical protein n=1 Tax=Paraburkholderia tropica TaxID=92647 RepID=UPI00182212EE|nr:hypothetical protein [Paraburkholderia tropica]MBB2984662.1 hypothetical protein [Paraburkholderia tropica]